ncbi:hypothetical protein BDZ89DRAFT_1152101 [Hymenopellis radicata]|nr:hypothetical protein BDZ89DRAFT_1152101 [Hymenopellis radicata]
MLPDFELANPETDGVLACFPLEILARILRMAWTDAGLLRVCSIVNKSFRAFACRITFNSICCGEPTATRRSIKRWRLCLIDSPYLSRYIRDITIIGRFPDNVNQLARLVTSYAENRLFPDNARIILSSFPNIAVNSCNIDADICFRMLSSASILNSLQIGVVAPCRYLTVNFDLTPVGVNISQGINVLKIYLTDDHDAALRSEDGLLRLFIRVQQIVRWRLNTFEFCAPARCSSGLPAFLCLLREYVNFLTVLVYDQESILWPTINFDAFVNLTELRLGFAEENIKVMCSSLSTVALCPRLSHLLLEIGIDEDSVPSRWYPLGKTLHSSDLCLVTDGIRVIIHAVFEKSWGYTVSSIRKNINAHSCTPEYRITNSRHGSVILGSFPDISLSMCCVTISQVTSILSLASLSLEVLRLGYDSLHAFELCTFVHPPTEDVDITLPNRLPLYVTSVFIGLTFDSSPGLLPFLDRVQVLAGWKLSTLSLSIPGSASDGAHDLIRHASPTLITLDVEISADRLHGGAFSLTLCHSLQNLHLTFCTEDVVAVSHIIASLPPKVNLTNFDLTFITNHLSRSGWADLGKAVETMGLTALLGRVRISCIYHAYNGMDWDSLVSDVRSDLNEHTRLPLDLIVS